MKKVLLIGIGLIGGSMALAIKKEHNVIVCGYDIEFKNIETALRLGVIDEAAINLETAAKESDLILIATPVEETLKIMDVLKSITPTIKALVMDAGSTKKAIMEKAKLLSENGISFIGGHPMAGSHKTGVESAKVHLFENAYFILTPSRQTSDEDVHDIKEWLRGTRSKFLVLNAEEHDLLTGIVSHFPQLIASSLVRIAEKYSHSHPLVQQLAAGGFRDTTRIASSSPKMWVDIVIQNKAYLLSLLKDWEQEMENVKRLIMTADPQNLHLHFEEGKRFRDGLPVRTKGAVSSFSDLYVDILDKVGAISKVTALLAEANLSLINLTILEVREGLDGVLRLSFQNESERDRAQEVLNMKDYLTHVTS
jgi:prephenate dehydrogenase